MNFNFWLVQVLLACSVWNVECVDLTRKAGKAGCEVAKAVVDKLTTSNIFTKEHNFLLYRAAFASSFGSNIIVTNRSGIWQLNDANLRTAQSVATSRSLAQKIQMTFDIEMDKVKVEDLEKPLVNGLVAHLLIEGSSGAVPLRVSSTAQLQFWNTISSTWSSSFDSLFNQGVTILDSDNGASGSACLVCHEQPTDLIFIMDESGSIGADGWNLQRQFVSQVVSRFRESMNEGATKSALVTFHSSAAIQTRYTTSYYSFDRTLQHHQPSFGGTNIATALRTARSIVNGVGSRKDDQGVKKLVFLLTDGQGGFIDQEAAALKQLPVNIYAIGMTTGANRNELLKAASKPEYVRMYNSVGQFQSDVAEILFDTCQINAEVKIVFDDVVTLEKFDQGGNVEEEIKKQIKFQAIKPGETRSFQMNYFNNTVVNLRVSSTKMDITVYASFSQMYPSEVDHDFKKTVKKGDSKPLLFKNPDQNKSSSGVPKRIGIALKPEGNPDCGSGCKEDISTEIIVKQDVKKLWTAYKEEFKAMEEVIAVANNEMNDNSGDDKDSDDDKSNDDNNFWLVVAIVLLMLVASITLLAIIPILIVSVVLQRKFNVPVVNMTRVVSIDAAHRVRTDFDHFTYRARSMAEELREHSVIRLPFWKQKSADVDCSDTQQIVELTAESSTNSSICSGSDEGLHNNGGSSLDVINEENEVDVECGCTETTNDRPMDDDIVPAEKEVEHDFTNSEVDPSLRLLSENNSKSIFLCAENLEELLGLQFDGGRVEVSSYSEEGGIVKDASETVHGKQHEEKRGELRNSNSTSPDMASSGKIGNVLVQSAENNDVMKAANNIVCKLREIALISSATPNAGKCLEQAVTNICTNTMLIVSFARIVARLCLDQRKLGPNLTQTIEPVESLCTQMRVLASVTAKSLSRQEEVDESETSLGVMSGKLTQTLVSILKDSEACCLKGLHSLGHHDGKEESWALEIAQVWKMKLDAQRKEAASGDGKKERNDRGLRTNVVETSEKETRLNEFLE